MALSPDNYYRVQGSPIALSTATGYKLEAFVNLFIWLPFLQHACVVYPRRVSLMTLILPTIAKIELFKPIYLRKIVEKLISSCSPLSEKNQEIVDSVRFAFRCYMAGNVFVFAGLCLTQPNQATIFLFHPDWRPALWTSQLFLVVNWLKKPADKTTFSCDADQLHFQPTIRQTSSTCHCVIAGLGSAVTLAKLVANKLTL